MTLHTVAADGARLEGAFPGLTRKGRWLVSTTNGRRFRWLAPSCQQAIELAWNGAVAGVCALARWTRRDPRYAAVLAAVGVFRVAFGIDPLSLWWVGPVLGTGLAVLYVWVEGREG